MSEYSAEVLRFRPRRVINLIIALTKRKKDEKMFIRWVYEGFSAQIPFDEFKAKLKPIEKKSAKEILLHTQNIMEGATWQPHSLS